MLKGKVANASGPHVDIEANVVHLCDCFNRLYLFIQPEESILCDYQTDGSSTIMIAACILHKDLLAMKTTAGVT